MFQTSTFWQMYTIFNEMNTFFNVYEDPLKGGVCAKK